jgi:hypothetical protein
VRVFGNTIVLFVRYSILCTSEWNLQRKLNVTRFEK